MDLLSTHFKLIIRTLSKNRFFAFINILGLAVGLAVTFFTFLFVENEWSYESMHTKKDHIQRVIMHIQDGNYDMQWARVNVSWVNELIHEFEEVEHLIRFQNYNPRNIKVGSNAYKISHGFSTDPEVFEVFDFPFIYGNPKTALVNPHSMVLTRSMAIQFFGQENVVGKEIEITDAETQTYVVTGVMENLPSNTHLPINLLTSFSSPEDRVGWAYTYILMQSGAFLTSKMPGFVEKYGGEDASSVSLHLQNLESIHLESNLAREIVPNGNVSHIYLFGSVGVFILLMSGINFVNLNTAQSLKKLREIGVRKVLGSSSFELSGYFLAEALFIAGVAAVLGVGLVYLGLPIFQQISPLAIHWTSVILLAVLLATVLGGVAGYYPAFVLSRTPSVSAMKNQSNENPSWIFGIKNLLVGLQLVLCIVLVSSALITRSQFKYLVNKDLGLEKEHILAILNVNDAIKLKFGNIKTTLLQHAAIQGVSASMEIPSREIRDAGTVTYPGMMEKEDAPIMDIQIVEADFIEVMGIQLLDGRTFTPVNFPDAEAYLENAVQYLQDQPREYILNETAMQLMGWTGEEALGQTIQWNIGDISLQEGQIVGIIKDYHQETLKNKVDPLVIVQDPLWMGNILLKVDGSRTAEIIVLIEEMWKDWFPDFPLEYAFLDDMYHNLYLSEQRQLQLIYFFSSLAIVIAFLGIFGLISYLIRIREKEIAIRQILGANLSSITMLLSKRFIVITVVGTLIAVPLTWMAMEQWLQNYIYHVDVGPMSFVVALALVLVVFLLTVGSHLQKSMKRNIVETLKE